MAVQSLALGNAPLQSRLNNAGSSLLPLLETDFPEDLQLHFQEIINALTSKAAQLEGEGKLESTTRQLSNEEAEHIAERIIDLLDEISCVYCSGSF